MADEPGPLKLAIGDAIPSTLATLGVGPTAGQVLDAILKSDAEKRRLLRFVLRHLPPPATAADAEDVFFEFLGRRLEAVVRSHQVGLAPFPAYFYRCLERFCIDKGRVMRRRMERGRHESLDSSEADGTPLLQLIANPSPDSDPHELLECRESASAIHVALMKLPERHREVFILSWFDDLDHAQIAARLDISLGHVAVSYHRARKALAFSLRELRGLRLHLAASDVRDWTGLCEFLRGFSDLLGSEAEAAVGAGCSRALNNQEQAAILQAVDRVIADSRLLARTSLGQQLQAGGGTNDLRALFESKEIVALLRLNRAVLRNLLLPYLNRPRV